MKISVVGAGYVGLTLAAGLASLGHKVWVVRKDKEKSEALKQGKIHFFEPGLEELVKKDLAAGRLLPTTEYCKAIPQSDVVFIAVGTPSLPTGEADLTQLDLAVGQIGENLRSGYTVVVNKSTVPPGTTRKIVSIIGEKKKSSADFDIGFCPEFLREGHAVEDTFHPDRVILGCESEKAIKILKDLHKSFNAPILNTRIESAEFIKYAANAYLALRIVFADQLADLCERASGDIEEVIKGVGMDKRIGTHYWYPGLGYGGSCFPKDVAGFACFANQQGCRGNLFEKMDKLNKERVKKVLKTLEAEFGRFKGKKVGILGLACKKGTDDVRNSNALKLAVMIAQRGAKVMANDPLAMGNARLITSKLMFCRDPYEVAQRADALLILTDCLEFETMDYKRIKKEMAGNFLFDARNLLPKEQMIALGFKYLGTGR